VDSGVHPHDEAMRLAMDQTLVRVNMHQVPEGFNDHREDVLVDEGRMGRLGIVHADSKVCQLDRVVKELAIEYVHACSRVMVVRVLQVTLEGMRVDQVRDHVSGYRVRLSDLHGA
jgi:hypothetical protein